VFLREERFGRKLDPLGQKAPLLGLGATKALKGRMGLLTLLLFLGKITLRAIVFTPALSNLRMLRVHEASLGLRLEGHG